MTAFTQRALDWFLEHGIVAERLMTDNAWCYVKNRGLRDLLHRTRDLLTNGTWPNTPKTNGKVERYQSSNGGQPHVAGGGPPRGVRAAAFSPPTDDSRPGSAAGSGRPSKKQSR